MNGAVTGQAGDVAPRRCEHHLCSMPWAGSKVDERARPPIPTRSGEISAIAHNSLYVTPESPQLLHSISRRDVNVDERAHCTATQ